MNDLENILRNPLLYPVHAWKRDKIRDKFPELCQCPQDHFLSIYKYINGTPQRFYSESIYSSYFAWLEHRNYMDKEGLQQYIVDYDVALNCALLHLEEINKLDWHDFFEKLDDYELIRFIDQQVHPTYLRLIEAVYRPFCHIIAWFSRIDRGKGTDGLELFSIVSEIESKTNLSELAEVYKHLLRNGIAHGGITYLQKEILYQDKKGNKERYSDTEIIRIFDNLLDTCNAMALAISNFLFIHQYENYSLPQQLLLEELKEKTKTPWWEVVGCTPSVFAGVRQLIIYARPKTSDYLKVQFSTFQTGVLAESFAPGYDRYFFSLRSPNSWPGWAGFDGDKLLGLRMKEDACLMDYKGVLENEIFYHVPGIKMPRFFTRIQNKWLCLKLHWPIYKANFKKELEWPEINIREAKIHRNSWGLVLNGKVYLESPFGEITQDTVRKFRKRIIRKALSNARSNELLFSMARFLPLGFVRISVYSKDYRRRRLASFGLAQDLVCTIQVKRIQRIQCPDIMGGEIEQLGCYRIVWNRAWLDNNELLVEL